MGSTSVRCDLFEAVRCHHMDDWAIAMHRFLVSSSKQRCKHGWPSGSVHKQRLFVTMCCISFLTHLMQRRGFDAQLKRTKARYSLGNWLRSHDQAIIPNLNPKP